MDMKYDHENLEAVHKALRALRDDVDEAARRLDRESVEKVQQLQRAALEAMNPETMMAVCEKGLTLSRVGSIMHRRFSEGRAELLARLSSERGGAVKEGKAG